MVPQVPKKILIYAVALITMFCCALLTTHDVQASLTVTGLGGMCMSVLDDEIAALTAQVSATTTVDASATLLVQSIPTLIQNAKDQALAAGATPAQLQAITDLGAALKAKSDPLAAAVSANTPAAPTG